MKPKRSRKRMMLARVTREGARRAIAAVDWYNPDALPSSEVIAKATQARRLVFGGLTPKIERGE